MVSIWVSDPMEYDEEIPRRRTQAEIIKWAHDEAKKDRDIIQKLRDERDRKEKLEK